MTCMRTTRIAAINIDNEAGYDQRTPAEERSPETRNDPPSAERIDYLRQYGKRPVFEVRALVDRASPALVASALLVSTAHHQRSGGALTKNVCAMIP